MIALMLFALSAAGSPTCSFGDYISVCNFTPPKSGAFRITASAQANATDPGPHRLTSEYVINGMHCRRSEAWSAGAHNTSATCVAELKAKTYYHVVATTNAQNAAHSGRVSITIEPTRDEPTLH